MSLFSRHDSMITAYGKTVTIVLPNVREENSRGYQVDIEEQQFTIRAMAIPLGNELYNKRVSGAQLRGDMEFYIPQSQLDIAGVSLLTEQDYVIYNGSKYKLRLNDEYEPLNGIHIYIGTRTSRVAGS